MPQVLLIHAISFTGCQQKQTYKAIPGSLFITAWCDSYLVMFRRIGRIMDLSNSSLHRHSVSDDFKAPHWLFSTNCIRLLFHQLLKFATSNALTQHVFPHSQKKKSTIFSPFRSLSQRCIGHNVLGRDKLMAVNSYCLILYTAFMLDSSFNYGICLLGTAKDTRAQICCDRYKAFLKADEAQKSGIINHLL